MVVVVVVGQGEFGVKRSPTAMVRLWIVIARRTEEGNNNPEAYVLRSKIKYISRCLFFGERGMNTCFVDSHPAVTTTDSTRAG